jgi:small subunit ribosomal protein S20
VPRIKSSIKDVRRTKRRRAANRTVLSGVKTAIRGVRRAGAETRTEALRKAGKVIDKAAQAGYIHRNAAARYKSRLAKFIQKPAAKTV